MSYDRTEVIAKSASLMMVALALCGLLLAAWTLAQPSTLSLDNPHTAAGGVALERHAP